MAIRKLTAGLLLSLLLSVVLVACGGTPATPRSASTS